MFERFIERARTVVVLSQEAARARKHNYIGTEHLLIGLLAEYEGIAAHVLASVGVTTEGVDREVGRLVPNGEEPVAGQIPFTPRGKKVCEGALREALSLGHNYIGTEHILLALVRENEGIAARILLDLDADSEKVRTAVMRVLLGPDAVDRVAEYKICKQRGHQPNGTVLTTNPPKNRCKWCGTTYWEAAALHETGAPR